MQSYLEQIGSSEGVNLALRRRYDNLEKIASDHGVLEQGLIPHGMKTSFAKVVDLLMRPNYAVAGAVDRQSAGAYSGNYSARATKRYSMTF